MSQIISREGYTKLADELHYLETVKRREVADRIESAKELGDLSENAEYAEAKDQQAYVAGRIAEITSMLKNVEVVDNEATNSGAVGMGSHVTVVNVSGEAKVYQIVSFNEADPTTGKISNESPLGLNLLGKGVGESFTVKTPKGDILYKINKVE